MAIYVVIVLVIAFLVSSGLRKNHTEESLNTSFEVERVVEENLHLVKQGDLLNLWAKPNSNRVYFYAEGSIGGEGLIIVAISNGLHKILNNGDKKLTATITIMDLDKDDLKIDINF